MKIKHSYFLYITVLYVNSIYMHVGVIYLCKMYLHIKVICGFPMNTTSTILFNRVGKKSYNTV